MDGQRLMDEEMIGLECELVSLKWYEKSKEETAIELLRERRSYLIFSCTELILNLKNLLRCTIHLLKMKYRDIAGGIS